MNEEFLVQLKAIIDKNSQENIEEVIKKMEDKFKLNLKIDTKTLSEINVTLKDILSEFKNVTNKMASQAAQTGQKIAKNLAFDAKKGIIGDHDITDFKQRLDEIRAMASNVIDVKVNYGKSLKDGELGKIDSAVVTYSDALGRVTRETMAWADVTDQSGKVVKKQWQTISVSVQDNKQKVQSLSDTLKVFKDNMNFKLDTLSSTKQVDTTTLDALRDSVNNLTPSTQNIKQIMKDIVLEYKKLNAVSVTYVDKQKYLQGIEKQREELARKLSSIMKNSSLSDTKSISLTNEYSNLLNMINQVKTSSTSLTQAEAAALNSKVNFLNTIIMAEQRYLDQKDREEKIAIRINGLLREVQTLRNNNFADTNQLNIIENQLKGIKINSTDASHEINKISTNLKAVRDETNRVTRETEKYQKLVFDISQFRKKQLNKLTLLGNTDADKSKIQSLIGQINSLSTTTPNVRNRMKELSTEIQIMSSQATRASAGLQNFIGRYFNLYYAIGIARRAIREFTEVIMDYDKLMTEIRVVTGENESSVQNLAKDYNVLARELGSTTREVMKGSIEWIRQGKSLDETRELLTASTMQSRLANIEAGQSTEYLTSVMNGYKKEASEALDVVSALVAVDNSAATSVAELAEALSRTSNSANLAGVSFEKLVGYVGTVSSVTRKSAETVGESYKGMFARMSDIKIGKLDEDGTSISDVETVLERVNIKFRSDKNTFREMDDVIDEVAKKWKYMDDVTQSSVAKAIAGTRQRENFIVLMENYGEALRLENIALNSSGLATERYGIVLESTESKLNTFKASMEALITETLSSATVKNILDIGIGLADMATKAGGLIPILTGILGFVVTLKSQKIASGIVSIATSIGETVTRVRNLGGVSQSAFTSMTTGATSAGMAIQGMLGVIGLVSMAISSLIMLENNRKAKIEESNRAIDENVQKSNEEINAVNQLVSKYTELYPKLDTDNTVRNKILEVQKSIVEQLHLEKNALDLVNGGYKENIELIKKETLEKLKQNEAELRIKLSDEQGELEKTQRKGLNYKFATSIYKNVGIMPIIEQLEKELAEEYGKNVFSYSSDDSMGIFSISTEDTVEQLEIMEKVIQKLTKAGFEQDPALRKVLENYNNLKESAEKVNTTMSQLADNWAQQEFMDITQKLGIVDIGNMTEEQLGKISEAFQKENVNYSNEYKSAFENLLNSYRDNAEETSDDIGNSLIGTQEDSLETLKKLYENAAKSLSDYKKFSDEIKLNGGLSKESIDEIVKSYSDLQPYVNDNIKLVEVLTKKIDEQKQKQLDAYKEIMLESGNYQNAIGNAMNDKKFYEEKIKGNKETADKIVSDTENMLKELGILYKLDLKEFTTIQQLKQKVFSLVNEKYGGMFDISTGKFASGIPTEVQVGILNEVKEIQSLYDKYAIDLDLSGTDKKKKKDLKYIEQGYDDIVAIIETKREEVQSAITKTQKAMDYALSLGNEAMYKQQSEYLQELQDQQIKVLEDGAKQLRAERDKIAKELAATGYMKGIDIANITQVDLDRVLRDLDRQIQGSEEAQQNALQNTRSHIEELVSAIISMNKTINSYSSDWFDVKNEKIEEYIDNLQRVVDKEAELIDEQIRLYDMQQELVDEDSIEYLAIEQQKYDALIEKQKLYYDMYQDVLERGVSAESETARKIKDLWYDIEEEIFEMKKSMVDRSVKIRQREYDGINEYREKTIQMLEDEHERWKKQQQEKIDALKDELDGKKRGIDLQKEALKKQKEEYDYQKKILDIRKSIEEISSELGTYKYDDSAEGIQRRLELEKQLSDKQEELKDAEYNNFIKKQEELLDKMIETIEASYQAQIAAIEAQMNQEVDFRKQADAMIQVDAEGTYQKLLAWNKEYGTSIDADITNVWLEVRDVLDEYDVSQKGVLSTLNEIANKMIEIRESADELQVFDFEGNLMTKSAISSSIDTNKVNDFMNGAIPTSQSIDFVNNILPNLKPNNTNIDLDNKTEINIAGVIDQNLIQTVRNMIEDTWDRKMSEFSQKYFGNKNFAIQG